MATNTYVALDKVTVSGTSTTSVTLSGISGAYTDLRLVINSQNQNSTNQPYIQFNADTSTGSTNYSTTSLRGDGSSAASSRHTNQNGWYPVPGPGVGTTGNFQPWLVDIMNYSNTTTNKSGISRFNNSASVVTANAHLWRSTAAITSITITAEAGAGYLVAGSTFSLYGIAASSVGAKATGGIISSDSQYYYHTFLASGTFTPTQSLTCDYLVVAGGGGGAYGAGGGGGGGGYRTSIGGSPLSLSATGYTVTIGAGGSAGTSGVIPTAGANSTFSTVTSSGGGRGAQTSAASSGGSGGGGNDAFQTGASGNAGSYSPVEGYAGGNGRTGSGSGGSGDPYAAGGGGGASQVGANATISGSGKGGDGSANSISGTSITYAGGGGGGADALRLSPSGGAGGAGGGGAGGGTGGATGTAGTVNTGGGGGGGANNSPANGGAGGSGIVIVRYAK